MMNFISPFTTTGLFIFGLLGTASSSPLTNIEQARSVSGAVFETTYQYPLKIDPIIFNVPADGSTNTTGFRPTQVKGQIYVPGILKKDKSTPVVVLFSGRHADCRKYITLPEYGPFPLDFGAVDDQGKCSKDTTIIPGYRGYEYLAHSLARDGYVVLSIDPTMLNQAISPVPDDPNLVRARARLLLRNLQKLELWNTDSNESLKVLGRDISGCLNTTAIGLMGHSRGGAATRIATNLLMSPENLAFQDVVDWKSTLKSRIEAVFDVAPYDVPENGKDITVIGPAWGLLASGCEDDETDYAYLRLYQRQSRYNPSPNYYLMAYGAGHNFYNTEWRSTFDMCLGDQLVPYPPPKIFNYTLPNGIEIEVPLVQESKPQRQVLEWACSTFMKAHLGEKADSRLSKSLKSSTSAYDNGLKIPGIEVGRANPNLASSKILQNFTSYNEITVAPGCRYVQSLAAHAKHQFPSFKSDVEKFGPPRNFALTPISKPVELLTNVDYDMGAVVKLPKAKEARIYIPFSQQMSATSNSAICEIQIDLARQDPCLLSSPGPDHGKFCARPQNLEVQVQAGDSSRAKTLLRSRFSVEFVPYRLATSDYPAHQVSLFPPAWETLSLPCPKQGNIAGVNITVTVPSNDNRLPVAGDSYLYIGPIRQVTL